MQEVKPQMDPLCLTSSRCLCGGRTHDCRPPRETQRDRSRRYWVRNLFLSAATILVVSMFGTAQTRDYSKFSHSTPAEHARLMDRNNCQSCHRPNGQLRPAFPVHNDCTGCHLVQFTQAGTGAVNPICTVCHNTSDLAAGKPTMKSFSGLRSFNAQFDHAQHWQGAEAARPQGGCITCHAAARGGVARTIPGRMDAHRICYDCHAPGKAASQFSSCGSCHAPGRYSPTSTGSRAYRLSFSHASHSSRQRLDCQSCHRVKGRGLPQRSQVSSITPVEHLIGTRSQTCKTCHNLPPGAQRSGLRAFGDKDTHDCKRCHRREDFRMRG
jgi:predicted CXXCH cytochrome family protein